MKTQERRHWRCSSDFIVNFQQISLVDLTFSVDCEQLTELTLHKPYRVFQKYIPEMLLSKL